MKTHRQMDRLNAGRPNQSKRKTAMQTLTNAIFNAKMQSGGTDLCNDFLEAFETGLTFNMFSF